MFRLLLTNLVNKNSVYPARKMSHILKNHGNLVFMDMEMTGLNLEKDRVIQVAMLITDAHLNIISTEFSTIINQKDEVLENMNEWCKENLKDLAEQSRLSDVTESKAEEIMLDFISQYVKNKEAALAGNTIYMDRMFLRKYFPRIDDYLHYRIVDVSSIKELCGRWNRKVYNSAPKKEYKHRALEDVYESIKELKYYKEFFFVADNN